MKYQKIREHSKYLAEVRNHLQKVLEAVQTLENEKVFSGEQLREVTLGLFETGLAWDSFKDVPTYEVEDCKQEI